MRKKVTLASIGALAIAAGIWGLLDIGDSYVRLEFMDVIKAQELWANQVPFDAKTFNEGTEEIRASMVVDLIQAKKYLGDSITAVRESLGPPDGYLNSEAIAAYIIQSREPGEKKDAWQIVFIPDKPGGTVKEVKIHKNCCYGREEYGP